MTPDERKAAIDAIGWSWQYLAGLLAIDERTARRWFRDPDTRVPPAVDEWLELLADFHRAHPPPARPDRP
jgi:hypothetical protein